MKIQDLIGSKEIDMSAVHGGQAMVDLGDSQVDLEYYLKGMAKEYGPVGLIVAAASIVLPS